MTVAGRDGGGTLADVIGGTGVAKAKKQAGKAVFVVRSAESKNGGVGIKGAARDSARIGRAARESRSAASTMGRMRIGPDESTPPKHTVHRYEQDGVLYEDHRWYRGGGTVWWDDGTGGATFCASHGVYEDDQRRPYRSCLECGHVWTRWERRAPP